MSVEGNVGALVNGEARHAWQENSRNMLYWTNKSGGDLTTAAVVVFDTANAKAFKTTTTKGDLNVVGVIPQIDGTDGTAGTQTIANNAAGYIQHDGHINAVNMTATTAIGDYLIASATAGKADPVGYPVRGAFGRATSACTGVGAVSADLFDIDAATDPSGTFKPYGGRTAPTGYLLCNAAAVSRATYATLFNAICPTLGNPTLSIASPCVVSLTAHGLLVNDAFYFTTTGALPTGVSANTLYYVISAGFGADAFEFSATLGGGAVNSSGSQSGVHSLISCAFGLGDGSTTFNVPDMRHRNPMGAGTVFGVGQNEGTAEASRTPVIPAHTHAQNMGGAGTTGTPSGNPSAANGSDSNMIIGASTGGNIVKTGVVSGGSGSAAYVAVNYIIKC